MTRIIVINLDEAEARWEHISQALRERGLTAERFSAVNGKKQNHPLFERYDDELRKKRKGDALTRGQLGCFASHFLVWKQCVELNEPLLVLEDDITVIDDRLNRFLELVHELDDRVECVRLFKNNTKHHKVIPYTSLGDLAIVKYTKGPMSGMGYYLTPGSARKFISNADKWFLAVDMYMDRFWTNKVECFGVIPECIRHDYLFESMIGYAARPKRSLSMKIRREVFSLVESTRRFLHNLQFRMSCWGRLRPAPKEEMIDGG